MDPTQPPTQQPPQPLSEVFVPQPKPNKFKIFLFIVFINTLFSIISYLYMQNQRLKKQFTQQQITPTVPANVHYLFPKPTDEMAGWKTYTSTELNITFKYPPEYKLPEENDNYISLISPLNPEPKKGYQLKNGELKIEIYTSDANPNESLIELIKKKKEQSDSLGADVKIIKEEEIFIDNIKAIKQTWEGTETGQTILFIKNNKEFGIIKYPAVTTRDYEFNQILSTFKFTDVN